MFLSPRFASRGLIAALLVFGLLGCTSSSSSSSSSSQSKDQTRAAERMAAAEWQMRQFQQQPRSKPRHEKLVYPQPVEDPLNPGRDLEPRGAAAD